MFQLVRIMTANYLSYTITDSRNLKYASLGPPSKGESLQVHKRLTATHTITANNEKETYYTQRTRSRPTDPLDLQQHVRIFPGTAAD